jgi:hypothetical protein
MITRYAFRLNYLRQIGQALGLARCFWDTQRLQAAILQMGQRLFAEV